ncbi:MAG: hypothetical protein K9G58_03330 [Bacteroidales bacterium]|nr:hypothetical protein [Bacteroidales bacterium]MCF8387230.1 hypothetical protein [Bacteroidales bacterium]MCF8397174.1 hypothetical protein [Bacteroidales bacterium]
MREIVVLIPDVEPEQNVEIEVRINGRKKTLQYRVELLDFEGSDETPTKDKVTVLRHKLAEYDKNWELVEIGAPDKEENIPLMFRRKSDSELIHKSKKQ